MMRSTTLTNGSRAHLPSSSLPRTSISHPGRARTRSCRRSSGSGPSSSRTRPTRRTAASRGRSSSPTALLSLRQKAASAASRHSTLELMVPVTLPNGLEMDGSQKQRRPQHSRHRSNLRTRSCTARRRSCGTACLTCELQAFELTSAVLTAHQCERSCAAQSANRAQGDCGADTPLHPRLCRSR